MSRFDALDRCVERVKGEPGDDPDPYGTAMTLIAVGLVWGMRKENHRRMSEAEHVILQTTMKAASLDVLMGESMDETLLDLEGGPDGT